MSLTRMEDRGSEFCLLVLEYALYESERGIQSKKYKVLVQELDTINVGLRAKWKSWRSNGPVSATRCAS
jgi:hypothetical protein